MFGLDLDRPHILEVLWLDSEIGCGDRGRLGRQVDGIRNWLLRR
jgi:hypothetical protein